ncbi:MAG: glucosaminidase domain-containing protein [Alphaproteobacteria bacterium]|nr:glucosaminidase domain-containing protein [Alphaproteobacteria bacterium]
MLKPSKIQISLIITLGLMLLGQMGCVLYKSSFPDSPSEKIPEIKVTHAGPAKAFGLVRPQEKHFQVSSVKELNHVFNNWEYNLTKAKSEGHVPRLYLAKLPKDMRYKKSAANSTFVQILLPHILKVNEQILVDRARLIEMQKRQKEGHHLCYAERTWLNKLASEYRCKSTRIESLLVHVDVVPPSLALAQAILETGGGRSSAALKKNSPFGYMATKTQVAKFESLLHSVQAYTLNLNRHVAYTSFRKERAAQRKSNQTPCGHKLAPLLVKYSVRGPAYTKDLQNLIHNHGLKGYDSMILEQPMRLKP